MARSRSHLRRQGNTSTSIRSTLLLARWQLRQTWRLLLVVGIGILVAVILICSVPLYSEIAINAGVRDAFNASFVTVHYTSEQVSAHEILITQRQIYQEFHTQLGLHGSNAPQFSPRFQELPILPSLAKAVHLPKPTGNKANLIGADMRQAGSHLKLLQGRLPRVLSKDIEIALEPITASDLHLKVGDTLSVQAFVDNVPVSQWRSPNRLAEAPGLQLWGEQAVPCGA